MQLTGRRTPLGSVRLPVDHHAARTADSLTAIVLECDGLLALQREAVVDDVEHLEERGVGADLVGPVLLEPPGLAGASCRQTRSVRSITCSSSSSTRRSRTTSGSFISDGSAPTPSNCQADTKAKFSSSRLASPPIRLVLDPEVAPTRLLTMQGVTAHELGQLEVVGDPARLLQRLVDRSVVTENPHVGCELFPQRGISAIAFSRPVALRAMPQCSHMILPSSRWNQSTVRLPLVASSRPVRSRTSALGLGEGRVVERAPPPHERPDR
jgi:hypothetical protein